MVLPYNGSQGNESECTVASSSSLLSVSHSS